MGSNEIQNAQSWTKVVSSRPWAGSALITLIPLGDRMSSLECFDRKGKKVWESYHYGKLDMFLTFLKNYKFFCFPSPWKFLFYLILAELQPFWEITDRDQYSIECQLLGRNGTIKVTYYVSGVLKVYVTDHSMRRVNALFDFTFGSKKEALWAYFYASFAKDTWPWALDLWRHFLTFDQSERLRQKREIQKVNPN